MSKLNGEMTKAEAMDSLMESSEQGINSSEIITIIHQAFNIDLESALDLPASPRAVIEEYLERCGNKVTGGEIRKMINETLRINLEAISALEGARISIFSKNKWIIQDDKDLFVVHTGTGDLDVRITPTSYFSEQTGSSELPVDLINALVALGFYYEEKIGGYYFSNPTGDAIPDAFKGQTMMAVRKVIHDSYSHL
jgi:hypothetical protein